MTRKLACAFLTVLSVACSRPPAHTVSAEGPPSGVLAQSTVWPPISAEQPCQYVRSGPTPRYHIVDKKTHLEITAHHVMYDCKVLNGKEDWQSKSYDDVIYRVSKRNILEARKCAGALNAAQKPYGQAYYEKDYEVKDIIQHQSCDWLEDDYPQKSTAPAASQD